MGAAAGRRRSAARRLRSTKHAGPSATIASVANRHFSVVQKAGSCPTSWYQSSVRVHGRDREHDAADRAEQAEAEQRP